ncbi:MAG: acyclic terpene utilization AtuA family protein [Nitrospinae bacterium]|nr:acyclic terpene utilization AtuA family protein [Nitrospinota bacterium]
MFDLRVVAATGLVGYGFPEASLRAALDTNPHVVGGDGGSCDPGPYYLGAGVSFTGRNAVKRDVALMLTGALRKNIPMIIGSAGGAGGAPHVAWVREIIEEIAREQGLHFRMAIVHAEQDKGYVLGKLAAGKVKPLGPVPDLTERDVERAERIVGMMGAEPMIKALDAGAQVVLTGRSSDAAIYAAVPLREGFPPGLAWHLGKIIECGAAVAEPKIGSDCMLGYLRGDHFIVECPNPQKICTRVRVAAHTLYENASPFHLYEPSGMIDTSMCTYEQSDARTVKVSGSRFVPADRYTIKLEGAQCVGYRTISIAGTRDPILIRQIDAYVGQVHSVLDERAKSIGLSPADYKSKFRLYGKRGVMEADEPKPDDVGHELGIVIDVVGRTQEIANDVLAMARTLTLHTEFEGRLCIAGNMAFPYSPSDIPVGPVYRFSLWHLVEPADPYEMFPMELVQV